MRAHVTSAGPAEALAVAAVRDGERHVRRDPGDLDAALGRGSGRAKRLAGPGVLDVNCPGASRVAGADWTAPASNLLNIDLSLFQDGWPSPVGIFYATNSSPEVLRVHAHRVRVQLTAGRTVGDDGGVTLQLHAACISQSSHTQQRVPEAP